MERNSGERMSRRGIESYLTQAAYCAAHGLSTKWFYRWRRKQGEAV